MRKILIGSLLAAIAVFIWGFLYWNVFPLKNNVFTPVPDERGLAQELGRYLSSSGAYAIPDPRSSPDPKGFVGNLENGPIAEILYQKEGSPAVSGGRLLAGLIHMFLSALLMALLLNLALPQLRSYGSRVTFVLLAGLAGAFFAHLGNPIWFHQPWSYHIFKTVYDVTCWALAGLVLARFVRPDAA
ncbi:MAG TPA: hypothetical protein VGM86_06085 [Thermoanaerobaculia bacterium]|jgi:hypothetical protein